MSTAPTLESQEYPTRAATAARVARLFEKHSRMVYGICRAILRDGHEAEDATQQTFLHAHRALLGGARVRNDAAWLATIARNESRTRIAARMRTPLPVSDEELAAIPTTGDEAERSAQLEAIRTALADLPERQREAVILRDLYGLRYGEVATALGLSRPATEALLFRARRALRHRLKPIVATTLVVPISVQEGLAQAIPGFAAAGAGSGGVAAGVAGGGLLAKLTAGPVGIKVATATVAVTTVGAVGSAESERAGRDRAERPAVVSIDDSRSGGRAGSDSSGPGSGGASGSPVEDELDERSSGPGSGDDRDDDNSGPGSSSDRDGSGDGDGSDERSESGSGSSGSSSGDDTSGPSSASGSGSSGSGSSDSGSSGGSEADDSSGSGDDGSSSSAPSSGEGSSSGPSSDQETTVDDSSGSDSGRSGSGESGSSGSGSSGGGSDDSSSGHGSDDAAADD